MKSAPLPNLQHRIETHLRNWSVDVEHITETETSILLFGHRRAQPVVVKVVRTPGDEWRSGPVLAAFDGPAVVHVYEYTDGAQLLERLTPGTPLVQMVLAGRDGDATDILAAVIGAMAPRRLPSAVPTALDWARGFDRYSRTGDAQIPQALLAEARALYLQLCHSQAQVRLLHGDLQHYNVLLDAQRGWLAIDPKGVIGELEYEIGAALRNPSAQPALFAQAAIVERRLKRFADQLPIDQDRALAWGFAQAVLSAVWTVEDGVPLGPHNPGILLAQAIRPMLGGLR